METALAPEFAQLPGNAKVWIWQSATPLDAFLPRIGPLMDGFVQGWLSHGMPVRAAWQVLYGHFIVVAGMADDGVGGCSTDGLQRTIQQVAQATGLDLHDRMKAGLLGPDGRVQFLPLKQVRAGEIGGEASSYKLFDLTVSSLGDLKRGWPVALVGSWAELRAAVKG